MLLSSDSPFVSLVLSPPTLSPCIQFLKSKNTKRVPFFLPNNNSSLQLPITSFAKNKNTCLSTATATSLLRFQDRKKSTMTSTNMIPEISKNGFSAQQQHVNILIPFYFPGKKSQLFHEKLFCLVFPLFK